MEVRRSKWTRPDYHYKGTGDFLLQHGVFYTGRQLPDQYQALKGPEGTCYESALAAALADPSLRYVEGVYSVVGEDFKGHAWCIDQEGLVVEVTQPTDPETLSKAFSRRTRLPYLSVERWGYFGTVFPVEYVVAHRERYLDDQGYALFDLSAYEWQWQREQGHGGPSNDVGWQPWQDRDDGHEDEDEHADWDDEYQLEFTPRKPHEYPTLKVPFDPNRTALP